MYVQPMVRPVANSKAKPVKNESSRQLKTIQTVLIQESSGKKEREEIAGYKSDSLEP